MVNQAKPKSYKSSKQFMYRYEILKTYAEAIELDRRDNNTTCHDSAVATEQFPEDAPSASS
jgi:hypothetical protein